VSYDDSVFRAPAEGPMEAWPSEAPPALGTVAEVRQRVDELLHEVTWTQHESTWFARCDAGPRSAEVQVTPEADGQARFVTIRRVERALVEELCDRLGLVAVDPQAMRPYRPEARAWSDAR
jgi:hypothetical protein